MATIRLKSDSRAQNSFIFRPLSRRFNSGSRFIEGSATLRCLESLPPRVSRAFAQLPRAARKDAATAAAKEAGEYPETPWKSAPGIAASPSRRPPRTVEQFPFAQTRSQKRHNAIVDPLRRLRLAG